jgi:hypothetical protein
MPASRWALLIAVGVVLWGAACHRARAVHVQPSKEPVDDSVFVEVINDNYYDVRVHVVYQGGARHSIGTIVGNTRQAAVAIPWQPRALVIEVARIVGSGVYQSDALDVPAGDAVEVRIPPNLDVSAFFRRVGK